MTSDAVEVDQAVAGYGNKMILNGLCLQVITIDNYKTNQGNELLTIFYILMINIERVPR